MTGREEGPGAHPDLLEHDPREEINTEGNKSGTPCHDLDAEVREHLERKRLPLPQLGHSRRGSPQTSAEAAARVRRNLPTRMNDVYRALRSRGPSIDEDLVEYMVEWMDEGVLVRQTPSSIRSRRAELVALGVVGNTGKKGTTKAGGKSIVWQVIE